MLKNFLFELGTLFAIINPYGLAFIFLNRTMNLTDKQRASVAWRVAINAFLVLIVSNFAGSTVLRFFGVSIPALRIAGGLVVVAAGWTLLHESPQEDERRSSSTQSFEAICSQAFFPLTVPLTTGPGTIATAITLAASGSSAQHAIASLLSSVLAAAIVCAAILHAYARVSRMARIFGTEGTRVIMRLSAFLLLCVGVQIILTGVVDTLRQLAPPTLGSN